MEPPPQLAGGFNPLWKTWVKLGSSSPSRDEHKKYLKPPTSNEYFEEKAISTWRGSGNPKNLSGPKNRKKSWGLEFLSTKHQSLAIDGKVNIFQFARAYLVGGWTNPFEKYARQIGSFPQI